jgi:hypothetical protein
MTRIFRFLRIRRSRAADAGRTLANLAAADREARQLTYRQAVRARTLEIARKHGVASAVEVLER